MVTKMDRAALEQLDLSQDYLPEEIRLEYELANIILRRYRFIFHPVRNSIWKRENDWL